MLLPHVLYYGKSDLTCWEDVVAIDFCDWCYCHRLIIDVVILADVVPGGDLPLSSCCSGKFNCPGWCYCHLITVLGWCYCHIEMILFGWCCCQVADIIATWLQFMFGWCYCQGGWWKVHPWVWWQML